MKPVCIFCYFPRRLPTYLFARLFHCLPVFGLDNGFFEEGKTSEMSEVVDNDLRTVSTIGLSKNEIADLPTSISLKLCHRIGFTLSRVLINLHRCNDYVN